MNVHDSQPLTKSRDFGITPYEADVCPKHALQIIWEEWYRIGNRRSQSSLIQTCRDHDRIDWMEKTRHLLEVHLPILSGLNNSSGTVNRSLFMIRIWSVSVTLSPGRRTRPWRFVDKSGSMYSWTIEFCFGSTLHPLINSSSVSSQEKRGRKNAKICHKTQKCSPTCLYVCIVVTGYEAAGFLYLIHDVRFVHHVPLAEGNEFFQMICE